MTSVRLLLAGAALLGLSSAALAWGADDAIGSVCGACYAGQSPEALALEMTVTQMRAHNPESQHLVIVNQPLEPYRRPISVRY